MPSVRPVSWVIRIKATREVLFETYNAAIPRKLNLKKYEAIPITKHLHSLSTMPKVSPQPTPKTKTAKGKSVKKLDVKTKLAKKAKTQRKPREPLWKGPEQDGITQSLLVRFMNCRERFRLRVIDGLTIPERFNKSLEYGNLWHCCEEAYAANPKSDKWKQALQSYAKELGNNHRMESKEVLHWYNVCKIQFPIYIDYWANHVHTIKRMPLLEEANFSVPYKLPSGRTVNLRGKWDSVDLVTIGRHKMELWLQENKTKGDKSLNNEKIATNLHFDLQTMFYVIALREARRNPTFLLPEMSEVREKLAKINSKTPLAQIRYNVIRRPLSGGKGTIRQHAPTKSNPVGETSEEFYQRLAGIIKDDPGYYFRRWEVGIVDSDLEKFEREALIPILESLCDWWEWISEDGGENPWRIDPVTGIAGGGKHWRHPYGIYNVLNEGGSTEYDEYLRTGSTVGLTQCKTLFPELE